MHDSPICIVTGGASSVQAFRKPKGLGASKGASMSSSKFNGHVNLKLKGPGMPKRKKRGY
jgi:hypothetical protein